MEPECNVFIIIRKLHEGINKNEWGPWFESPQNAI
jgi:hypothetical protein